MNNSWLSIRQNVLFKGLVKISFEIPTDDSFRLVEFLNLRDLLDLDNVVSFKYNNFLKIRVYLSASLHSLSGLGLLDQPLMSHLPHHLFYFLRSLKCCHLFIFKQLKVLFELRIASV